MVPTADVLLGASCALLSTQVHRWLVFDGPPIRVESGTFPTTKKYFFGDQIRYHTQTTAVTPTDGRDSALLTSMLHDESNDVLFFPQNALWPPQSGKPFPILVQQQ